jgi:hypothetical protein
MKTGNGLPAATNHGEDMYLRDDGRQLRDIEELVAKLRVVTKQLAFPMRTTPARSAASATGAVSATGALSADDPAAGTAGYRNVPVQGQATHGQARQRNEAGESK